MAGRPRSYGVDTPTQYIRLTLSKDLHSKLTAIAETFGMSPVQYVRSLCHQHVDKVLRPKQ